jgi:hypothetical protein
MPKSFDFPIIVVSPEKIAHVSGGWQGICQSLQSTPRCDLKGHGVFKGVVKRRKIPGEEEGKQRRSVEGYQRIARVIVRGSVWTTTVTTAIEGEVDSRIRKRLMKFDRCVEMIFKG